MPGGRILSLPSRNRIGRLNWLRRLTAMEKRLKRDLEQRHEDRLGQMSDALERRMTERIAPIEAEIENQRAAVVELREFSLRTETSLQKLLEGIERLVASQTFSKSPWQFYVLKELPMNHGSG